MASETGGGGGGTPGTFVVREETSGTHVVLADDVWLVGDATAGLVTFQLPDPSTIVGQTFWLKKIDSSVNIVRFVLQVGDQVDGQTPYELTRQHQVVSVTAISGNDWQT